MMPLTKITDDKWGGLWVDEQGYGARPPAYAPALRALELSARTTAKATGRPYQSPGWRVLADGWFRTLKKIRGIGVVEKLIRARQQALSVLAPSWVWPVAALLFGLYLIRPLIGPLASRLERPGRPKYQGNPGWANAGERGTGKKGARTIDMDEPPPNPYPGEWAARQMSPKQFTRFRSHPFGEGIRAILGFERETPGPQGGESEVQSLRFDKDEWSKGEAKEWLTEHGYRSRVE